MILGEHVRGGTAERVAVSAENLYRIPEELDFRLAAAAPLAYQTAWRALVTRGRLREGETLLVTGASGGVSTAAVQIGRLLAGRGELEQAEDHLRRAVPITRRDGSAVDRERLTVEAEVAWRRGQHERAEALLQEAGGGSPTLDVLRAIERVRQLMR